MPKLAIDNNPQHCKNCKINCDYNHCIIKEYETFDTKEIRKMVKCPNCGHVMGWYTEEADNIFLKHG